MLQDLLKIQFKAAIFIAAFFIASTGNASFRPYSNSLEDIKKKTSHHLVQKNKNAAIGLVNEYIQVETNKDLNLEATDYLLKVSQTFLNKDAQDAYEASINQTLDQPKDSLKSIEICLQLEPQNINCLIQKARMSYREKNNAEALKILEEISKFAKTTRPYAWLELLLNRENGNFFKNKNIIRKINEKPSEDFFVLLVLEIERAFLVKNFARAKEGIDFLERNYSDYPDLVYFKQKLDIESSEEKIVSQGEGALVYVSKCKSLSKSLSRKFRYDFDLCLRGRNE